MLISNTSLQILRTSASASGLARRAFSPGAQGLTAAQITMELRQLLKLSGIDVPQNVLVSIDSLQAILAGGQIVGDIAVGAATLQVVGDATNFVSAGLQIMSDLGIGGDATNQLADAASLASNVLLVISSGGLNILADIGAVISLINVVGDLSRDLFGSHDDAVRDAQRQLAIAMNQQLANYLNPQIQSASQSIRDYQNGSINYFDLIGNIALTAPVTFERFFPAISRYFPSWVYIKISATVTGSSSGLFSSSTDTQSTSKTFVSLLTNRSQVESVLFNYLIGQPMQSFKSFFNVSPGISLRAISVMSMILSSGTHGDVKIMQNFDLISACIYLGITPSVLGDSYLFKGLDKNELETDRWKEVLPYAPYTLPAADYSGNSGVVINGQEVLSSSEQKRKCYRDSLTQLQLRMQYLDSIGDIESLVKIPEAVAILKSWATFHPNHVLSTIPNAFDYFDPLQSGLNMTPFYTDPTQINISDYWKCLGIASQMIKASLFSDAGNILASMGDLDDIQAVLKTAHQFIFAKKMNLMAQKNVSQYLGIPFTLMQSRLTKNGTKVFFKKAG